MKAHFYVHFFASGGRQLCSLRYPVCQLHHVCRVDAEEDVQDFRQLRPGLDPPQVVVLFLTSMKFSAIARTEHQYSVPLTCRFILRFLQIQFCTAYWKLNSIPTYQRYETSNVLAINLQEILCVSR